MNPEEIEKLHLTRAETRAIVTPYAFKVDQALNVDHLGAKKYKNTQQQDEIDRLELQLSELKSEQAAIKQQMIELVISELKRRDDDYTI